LDALAYMAEGIQNFTPKGNDMSIYDRQHRTLPGIMQERGWNRLNVPSYPRNDLTNSTKATKAEILDFARDVVRLLVTANVRIDKLAEMVDDAEMDKARLSEDLQQSRRRVAELSGYQTRVREEDKKDRPGGVIRRKSKGFGGQETEVEIPLGHDFDLHTVKTFEDM
jgi:hypothetical protein